MKKSLMRMKKILMYFRKNTADNLSLNGDLVELVNGDLDDVADKLREVHKVVVVVVAVDPPAGAAGRLGVRRRRMRAR